MNKLPSKAKDPVLIRTYAGHSDSITSMSFSPDAYLVLFHYNLKS